MGVCVLLKYGSLLVVIIITKQMHFSFEHTPHSTLSDVFVMDFIPKDSVVEQLEKESRGRYEGNQLMLTGSSILFHFASFVSFCSLITV